MIWVGCVITGVAAADLTTIHVEWYWQNPLMIVTFADQKGAVFDPRKTESDKIQFLSKVDFSHGKL